ncbi:ral guanine nucleotide dissociation stimulator-like isoform X1 [Diceros bicornis minor]|uniref:ral guanine nucleotide dissociation stimulator-like isoform X1 n=1 Tax=Diceros bicornis minor TaxID=77932 RepID=UPI0026E9C0B9|nr:ral guanine nucleotide dissociation stimulator-like isoform X1 [Diceros bicornis minor]XP_058404664.1 ral guanine nucleotide dissociation stimulator-like isoform X1 [Diceros bicornis minor]XP_058404665.1 ral guanine nucleotide dissociation stimulator-like isoform X1 [Diceros bicornis minor]XP_058404666.1 ral guanine nucleotide dissociation stimulator-like isoform X1 [Diceros bicornis minor]XP_058404667.1 ral guanine nucleotide dissociation stimulator-like isoform X1 [Diceros bicornis minor]
MDAEPFQKVVPSQCLGSTWGKRNKPGSEHLAHTVQANIDHFRRVANLVITTCLGVPSMMAQDRVRVVERWIQVAQECEILKNFSSPRTVISSLQKTSICHLKNTWRKFPGGALHVCPPEGNPQRVQEKQQQQQGNEINLEKRTEEQLWHSLQGRGRRWKSETLWGEQFLAPPLVSYIEWKILVEVETHPVGAWVEGRMASRKTSWRRG